MRTAILLRVLGTAALVCLGLFAPTAAAASPPHSPWPQTNANAAQSRANRTESTLTTATVQQIGFRRDVTAPPPQLRDQCPGDSLNDPVLTGGSLFALVAGVLTRVDAATGDTVWHRNPDVQLRTFYRALAVSRGLVVIGGLDCISQSDPNGILQAFDARTGQPVWSRGIGPGLMDMVVTNGLVISEGDTLARGLVVAAYRLSDGTPVWSHQFSNLCDIEGHLLVVHQLVIHPGCTDSGQNFLAANRMRSGTRVWRLSGAWRALAGDLPSLDGTHLLVADSAGAVHDLIPRTGATRHVLTGADDVLAVGPRRAFTTCASGSDVCGYNLTSGARQWRKPAFLPEPLGALAAGVLYLDDGSALRSDTGAPLTTVWSGAASNLVIGDGRLAVVTEPRVLDLYGLPGS